MNKNIKYSQNFLTSEIVVSKSAPSILCYTPTLKTTLKKLFSGI
ncbi:Uncharacterised protein [Streptococcus pneumoniae]|nr:Uncharacterised protein [Streptococcus pneumoniae]CVU10463.1 Uncharacterised protein [Streptococcus pneumoniae]CWB29527.1 Uncharacterised protein [Streptococcus pneumoniae]